MRTSHSCVPHIVRKKLPNPDITTVQHAGWSGIKSGELLRLAEGVYDVFISSDKNLQYQQNVSGRKLAIVILPSNQVPIVESLIPQLEAALKNIKVGDIVEL
jgi:hypothetical protein